MNHSELNNTDVASYDESYALGNYLMVMVTVAETLVVVEVVLGNLIQVF